MRSIVTTALEAFGLLLIAVAAGLVSVPLGLLVAGAACVLVGWLEGRA